MTIFLSISSPQNPRIKAACALRNAKERRAAGLFLIDGSEMVQHAMDSGVRLREVFLSARLALEATQSAPNVSGSLIPRLMKDGSNHGVKVYAVEEAPMDRLQYGDRRDEVVAVAEALDTTLETLRPRISAVIQASQCYLVLDRMEKPGNLGAMLRTADATSVDAVLLSNPICDVFNPNVLRASLGALFDVPIAVGNEQQIADWLRREQVRVLTARVEGAVSCYEIDYPSRVAVVIGNEAEGLGCRWPQRDFESVMIPMTGKINSLNASVSSAVLLFEIARQRLRSQST